MNIFYMLRFVWDLEYSLVGRLFVEYDELGNFSIVEMETWDVLFKSIISKLGDSLDYNIRFCFKYK